MDVQLKHIELVQNTFRMFGDPDSPFWFLGLEESTDPELSADEQIQAQYRASLEQNKLHKVPLSYARVRPTYQRTWGGYIKLLLSVKNNLSPSEKNWTDRDVMEYQRKRLGALGKDEFGSCLMELYPLPRKTRSHPWVYSEIANRPGLEFLSSHSKYKNHISTKNRSEILLSHVEQHKPRALFCFGADCRKYFGMRLNTKLEPLSIDNGVGRKHLPAFKASVGSTQIVFSYHPAAFGVSDDYWRNLGTVVALSLIHI